MIITSEKIQEATKRLEDMKQATLLNYLDDIDFNNNLSWFDEMMKHFYQGDLSQSYYSSLFEKMSKEEKEKLLNLTSEYISLCFTDGDVLKWRNSVENVVVDDYDLICLKIFDNFNFLIEVSKSGGREALDLLKSFQNYEGFSNGAVIESLRNTFVTDSVLISVLVRMAQKDSMYNLFTDQQKAVLCCYPEGTLYSYDDKDLVKITPPLTLIAGITSRVTGAEATDKDALKTAVKNISSFQDVVSEMSIEYVRKYGKALNEMMKFINNLEKGPAKNYWNTEKTPLGDFVDTSFGGEKRKK